MADEIPPAPSESADDVTKSETIRITLPPKSEQPAMKRETVRINVPGKPVAPAGVAPKKETTKLTTGGGAAPGAPAAPFAPPPPSAPKPPGAPGLGAVKPVGGVTPPPKPPGLGARPTVPLKPAPSPSAGATPAPMAPVTQRAASPKKETARITLPPEGGGKPALPKATVKMQQTQPLVNRPAPTMSTSPAVAAAAISSGAEADPLVAPLSIAAVVLSLVALITTYLAYSAASSAL